MDFTVVFLKCVVDGDVKLSKLEKGIVERVCSQRVLKNIWERSTPEAVTFDVFEVDEPTTMEISMSLLPPCLPPRRSSTVIWPPKEVVRATPPVLSCWVSSPNVVTNACPQTWQTG